MSWFLSAFIALVTAAATGVAGGMVAALCVDWYRVSSREGASGYFVVLMGLVGIVAGLVFALVVSRKVAGSADPTFLRALAWSLLPMLAIVAAIAGAARLLADVPPKLGGEALLLAVELRFPPERTVAPADEPGEWLLRLSADGRRASAEGPLWKEDARRVDGRWVVPGAVEVFTQRGDRLLQVLPDGVVEHGFLVPLPAYPRAKHLEWSDWYPHARPGEAPLPEGVAYRFRVVPRSKPIRTEVVGPFEIDTIASSFTNGRWGDAPATYAASAKFALRHRGQPVTIGRNGAQKDPGTIEVVDASYARADAVAVIAGPKPALLVQVDGGYGAGHHYLIVDEGDRLRIDYVSAVQHALDLKPVTSDVAAFRAARDTRAPPGRVDRARYASRGLYVADGAVLDTRSLAVRRYAPHRSPLQFDAVPPLALSPDGRSIAQLDFAPDAPDRHVLKVTDFTTGAGYAVPIDRERMPYAATDDIDPAWVDRHFEWKRGAGGAELLAPRDGATPAARQ